MLPPTGPKISGSFWGTKQHFFGFVAAQVITNCSCLSLFHYCAPRRDLSNGLSSNPNGDHMQKLRPWAVDIPTYHFEARKIVGVSSSRVLFRVLFPSMIYVKKAFDLFVKLTWRMHVVVTSLLRDKLPPFKRVMLFYNLYSFCNLTSVIESKIIVYLCFFHISMCIISSSQKYESNNRSIQSKE